MKRLVIAVALMTGLVLTAAAQDIDKFFSNEKVRKELNLTDKEIQDLQRIWDDSEKQIQVARADRDVKASEMKRLLLEERVNMAAVSKVLREATDLEYKLRLAQVERVVKAKEILGEKRWADLHRLIRGSRMMRRGPGPDGDGPDGPGPDRPRRMMPLRNR